MGSILIKNGLLVDTEWTRKEDILIEDGKIARIARRIDASALGDGGRVIDAAGCCVLPGLVDAHTHYRLVSRGTVTADDFENGSICAAFGGCTTVVDFADHDKSVTLFESAEVRKAEMSGHMAVDYALHQGVYGIPADLETQLDVLVKSGVKIIKIFTTYRNVGYLIENKKDMERLFRAAAKRGMLITAHCEDNDTIENLEKNWTGDFKPASHSLLHPAVAEAKAIKMLGEIAIKTGAPLYVVHLSSKAGLDAVRKLRAKGAVIFAETTPTYLYKEKSLLDREDGALFIMTPPLRETKDNRALCEALENGELQVVATDHCAFTREQKLDSGKDCRSAYPGVPGTAEMFASVHSHIRRGKLCLQQLVNLMSTSPAKIFGLYPQKGSLHVGSDADIVIFDPKEQWKPGEDPVSKSGYSLFDGDVFTGRVKKTILRGNVIMEDGRFCGVPGNGRFVPEKVSSVFKYSK